LKVEEIVIIKRVIIFLVILVVEELTIRIIRYNVFGCLVACRF